MLVPVAVEIPEDDVGARGHLLGLVREVVGVFGNLDTGDRAGERRGPQPAADELGLGEATDEDDVAQVVVVVDGAQYRRKATMMLPSSDTPPSYRSAMIRRAPSASPAHWGTVLDGVLAVVVVVVHLAFVVVLVGGAFVVYHHPRIWKLHLPVVAAMTAVTSLGVDCPLTVLESRLRQRAGWDTYHTGFISHYLVEPWHPAGITPPIRLAIIAIWIVPNVIAYAAVVRWARHRTATPTAT